MLERGFEKSLSLVRQVLLFLKLRLNRLLGLKSPTIKKIWFLNTAPDAQSLHALGIKMKIEVAQKKVAMYDGPPVTLVINRSSSLDAFLEYDK